MRQRARADNLTVCYRKQQMDVSFSCVCPVIESEFRQKLSISQNFDFYCHRMNQTPLSGFIERSRSELATTLLTLKFTDNFADNC